MLLRRISLSQFRNFVQLKREVPEGTTILTGANAQGKTSLLEAMYLFTGASSPHTSSDRQLIRFEAPDHVSRLVGQFQASDLKREIEIRLIGDGDRLRKEILIDRQRKRAVDLAGGFVAVLFLPQDMHIIEGSPGRRRELIDAALGQASPEYGRRLRKFRRVMTQRNALLKRLQERSAKPEELDYWDAEFASLSAALMEAREVALQEMAGLAAPIHARLSGGPQRLKIQYQPEIDPRAKGSFLERLESSLQRRRQDEIARGVSLVGPHRDEIQFELDELNLRDYGSRGQNRTALLALKLAEIQWLRKRTNKRPVLLLDEVMSELDPSRRMELLCELRSSPQALLTTSDIEMIDPEFRREATIWQVEGGTVR